MNISTLGEDLLKVVLKEVILRLKKHYTSEVDNGLDEAFQLALADWSKHAPTTSDKVRLSKALEEYIQSSISYEALDADTRAFIDCFKIRLSEQPAAHRYLMMLRADMQAKSEEQNLLEHYKTQESVLDLKSRMEELNMAPQYIRALLKELPLEQGLECTESALEDMLANGRIHSEGAKRLVLEFVRFLFEHTDKISEETKLLREAGDSYLAETLEHIKRVLTGESEQSLTDVHKKYQEQVRQGEIRVLEELIKAAQIQFSFGEAREFYERLIDLAPTTEHHFNYAYLLQNLNDFDKARSHYEEVLHTLREPTELDTEVYKPLLAITSNNLGALLSATNDLKQAQVCYEDAIKLYQELSDQNPEVYKPYMAMPLNNLAALLVGANEFKQARACYADVLKLYQELSDQNLEAYKPYVAMTLNNIGNLHKNTNDPKKAQACYEDTLKLYQELSDQNSEVYRPYMAAALNNLGVSLQGVNDLKQAQAYYEEALQIRRKLSDQNPEAYKPDVAMILNNLTLLYLRQGKKEEAEKAYQRAHDIYQELAAHHPRSYKIKYAKILVIGFDFLGKPKEYLEEAKEILGKYPEHPKAQELLKFIEECV